MNRLASPRSAEELINEADFARDERLPYWADVWPSAIAMARALPGWAEVDADSWRTNRWRTQFHDRSQLDALLTTPGAIGLVDGASVRALGLPLPLLAIDGHPPTEEGYPAWKPLAFIVRGEPSAEVTKFIGCVRSPLGLGVIRSVGALPP